MNVPTAETFCFNTLHFPFWHKSGWSLSWVKFQSLAEAAVSPCFCVQSILLNIITTQARARAAQMCNKWHHVFCFFLYLLQQISYSCRSLTCNIPVCLTDCSLPHLWVWPFRKDNLAVITWSDKAFDKEKNADEDEEENQIRKVPLSYKRSCWSIKCYSKNVWKKQPFAGGFYQVSDNQVNNLELHSRTGASSVFSIPTHHIRKPGQWPYITDTVDSLLVSFLEAPLYNVAIQRVRNVQKSGGSQAGWRGMIGLPVFQCCVSPNVNVAKLLTKLWPFHSLYVVQKS